MSKKSKKEAERLDAIEMLLDHLPPGSTVWTDVVRVARSGMSRTMRCFIDIGDNDDGAPVIANVSWHVARALGLRWHDREGAIRVDGCGMDMGFRVVNCLSYALHGKKDVGSRAIAAAKAGTPFRPTAKQWRAGYSLKHLHL